MSRVPTCLIEIVSPLRFTVTVSQFSHLVAEAFRHILRTLTWAWEELKRTRRHDDVDHLRFANYHCFLGGRELFDRDFLGVITPLHLGV